MNENISEFYLFIICLVGSGKTVKGYINFGSANVFTTVMLPINVSFLWLQRFKQLLNSHNFGRRLYSCIRLLSEKKLCLVFKLIQKTRENPVVSCFQFQYF